ncbi:signal transduction histidine kinase [Panacagrimonas perspica]|uniref:histidine kinase n=1 Tax=Panacagrimonas perspica TaxID=381431 RepID=A0A4R7P572_9GAMM|nr:HAMP domain-containing sensor histidine kinase [Panacagrimonas perspica]TDU28945.1 signal transduction histidine kinase [Panacagrimonas perspica]THD02235.1 hypothetical protein B1810_14990 [Panacagrimonas perspica]
MRLSISTRLIGIAVVTTLALLPLFGYALSRAFLASAESSFDRQIDAYLLFLAGRLDSTKDGDIVFSRQPGDDRFEQLHSGWYWQVSRGGKVQETSRSLWDETLAPPQASPREPVDLRGPGDQALRGATLELTLGGLAEPVNLLVTGPRQQIDAEVASFNWLLVRSLGLLGLILVVALVAQIRWGLAPLRAMTEGLRQVRSGSAPRLDVRLPSDLSTVARAMNEVLAHQEELLERGRSVAGNLAHALKTPLATIRMKIDSLDDGHSLRADVAQIQRIVDHHLTLAAAAGRASGPSRRSALGESIEPVLAAVRMLHADRHIELRAELPPELRVAVDAQDLQELVGNLLDNAAKWARTRVDLRATRLGDDVLLSIEDDGPGIAESEREQVLSRGLRLDEQQPGSGLGLAIVKDLARLYRLQIAFERAPLGGLGIHLRFPGVPPP